jgi:hypothetical protein
MVGIPNVLEIVGGTGAGTFTTPDVPTIVGYTVSAAVIVWFPPVKRVTGNCAVPLVNVALAGSVAELSVLVKCIESV